VYVPTSLVAGIPEPSSAPGEDLTMALRHQLGLRVDTVKTPIEFVVIDHMNRIPTEN
jgi:uncharacterized protein (TIGR03435 family)